MSSGATMWNKIWPALITTASVAWLLLAILIVILATEGCTAPPTSPSLTYDDFDVQCADRGVVKANLGDPATTLIDGTLWYLMRVPGSHRVVYVPEVCTTTWIKEGYVYVTG